MSTETTEVILAQTRLMEMDLVITIQQMKIKELDARANTLKARSQMERHKLNQMSEQRKGLKNG
jgi:FtsZ-binding cell division protein ZapB